MTISITSEKKHYIGIMSGTSADGIDVVLMKIENRNQFSILHTLEVPYSDTLREQVLCLCETQTTSLVELGQLQHRLSLAYANAVNQLLKNTPFNVEDIAAIGCHGQTVCHAPDVSFPFSMQLVDPAIIVTNTRIPTITNFRAMDIALGGQGAPLVPLFHEHLFNKLDASDTDAKVLLNIGGIANISCLQPLPVQGFDTGPGNVLLDLWIDKCQGLPFDNQGAYASKGSVNAELLSHLLNDPYFNKPAPKSTGREYFNLLWLEKKLDTFKKCHLSNEDIMATLVALTAHSISNALPQSQSGELLIFGGGAKNTLLIKMLEQLNSSWRIENTKNIGIDADFMEAAAFAWLAYCSVNGFVGNAPQTTGAKCAAISGVIAR